MDCTYKAPERQNKTKKLLANWLYSNPCQHDIFHNTTAIMWIVQRSGGSYKQWIIYMKSKLKYVNLYHNLNWCGKNRMQSNYFKEILKVKNNYLDRSRGYLRQFILIFEIIRRFKHKNSAYISRCVVTITQLGKCAFCGNQNSSRQSPGIPHVLY